MIISHNLQAMNTQRQYGIATSDKKKKTEKLSSGYKINRAADDAAGLTISEKMRSLIRGLNQGTENAHDGVSWVQIGDGALNEVDDMIHRMKELTIHSLNETNTEADRAAMQAEFDQLQSEIDRITQSTEFNTLNIFEEHEPTYYQYEGNKFWPQDYTHVIRSGLNDTLNIKYRKDDESPEQSIVIKVPEGTYTTQELFDEIKMNIEQNKYDEKGFNLEYTDSGTCNINFEGGEKIISATGGLKYLLYDMSNGESLGALIGTTAFSSDTSKLYLTSENNQLSFTIQDENGVEKTKSITFEIPAGQSRIGYTKSELIDILNNKLSDTTVKAVSYGNSIKLESDDSIITGFKGNMFKIETSQPVYTSVFYDNVKYGNITLSAGTFTGGAVLTRNTKDVEHNKFVINSSNNTLQFQPNKSTTPTNITIPDGEYTASEMASKLNSLFTSSGLNLSAATYSSGNFDGLKITSGVVNLSSKVGLLGGTAYDTLFTKCEYTSFNQDDNKYNATANSSASVTGARYYNSTFSETITEGVNDKFNLVINGSSYEIKLSPGTYSAAEMINELNNKFSDASANAAYKDKVTAKISSSNLIMLSTDNKSGISSINVSAVSGNSGYNDIFRNKTQADYAASGYGKITLNTPVTDDPVTITSSAFSVRVDGNTKSVTLPTGTVSKSDIIDAINNTLGPSEKDNTFTAVNTSGNRSTFSSSNTPGSTSVYPTSLSGKGSTVNIQGTDKYTDTWASTGTTTNSVPTSMTIDGTNNSLKLTINGKTKTISLDNGSYTRSSFVSALQSKIDSAFGSSFGGALVKTDAQGRLFFTARPGNQGEGEDTSIAADVNTSSLLKYIETNKRSGDAKSTLDLKSSINLDSSNNTFTFNYKNNPYSITLTPGSYNPSSLISEINKQLANQNIDVVASNSSGKLLLTTKDAGTGNTVSFSANTGTNDKFASAVFSGYMNHASATLNRDLQSSITIDNTTNKFNINGKEVTLNSGTYNRSSFVSMLNNVFASQGVEINASLSGNRLYLTSTSQTLSNDKIQINYPSGGSSMKAIFGTSIVPGVEASFDGSGKLVLTATNSSTQLYVTSSMGNIFQDGSYSTYTGSLSTSTATSTSKSYVDGANISSPVEINNLNDQLKFKYISGGQTVNFDITLDHKSYSFSELKDALQQKINDKLGSKSGEIVVSVNSNGVRLESRYPGKDFQFVSSSFDGGFYDRVMRTTKQQSKTMPVSVHNGNNANDDAFTVGRRDIVNKIVDIKKDINDTLSFDITAGSKKYKIAFKLAPGQYSGNSLVNEIQDKMNTALKAKGLEEGFIKAQIGGVSTGVVGSNDANALVFKLAEDMDLPGGSGQYIIDGVGGSAAFSIFYQTEGDLTTAYMTGSKTVDDPVEITAEENQLDFTYDGKPVSISISEGTYSYKDLIDTINNKLAATGYPLGAEMTVNGNLKIYATKFGRHDIDNFSGSAKQLLFNQEGGEIGEEEDLIIQLSNITDDSIDIERKKMNTSFLDINSVCITQEKYSKRALEKLDEALSRVSDVRSYFGATQNRLEGAIRNNENKSENLTASESEIRDTDMAEMLVSQAKDNILMQVGEAMMAQANQSAQNVMLLLQ